MPCPSLEGAIGREARASIRRDPHSIDVLGRVVAAALVATMTLLAACTTPPLPSPPPAATPVQPAPTPTAPPVVTAKPVLVPTTWAAVPGWTDDPLTDAWPAFVASCDALGRKPEWAAVCSAARTIDGNDTLAVRNFFESRFVPNRVTTTEGNDTGS